MAQLDTRPPAVDLFFRPGDPLTVTVNFEAGALNGRTFASTLDATAITANVAGDIVAVSATAAQTAAVTEPVEWLLAETTGGASTDLIVGKWVPDDGPSAISSATVTVVEASGVVSATVSGVTQAGQLGFNAVGSLTASTGQDAFEQLAGVQNLDIRAFGATFAAARQGIQDALDTAALRKAFGASVVVYVAPGQWQLDAGLNVPSNVVLRGAGDRSILRMDDSTDAGNEGVIALPLDQDQENVVIESLVVDGNRANQATQLRTGIQSSTNQVHRNIWFRDLIVRNAGHYGIGIQGGGGVIENMFLENIWIENCGSDGIDIKCQASRNFFIRNVTVDYFGQNFGGQAAIDLRGTVVVDGVDIRSVGNDWFNNHVGIRLRQSGGGSQPAKRAGAVACRVTGVTVALTGASVGDATQVDSATQTNSHAAVGNIVETPALRRAQVVNLTEDGSIVSQSSYQTATVDAEPNTLLLLAVGNNATSANTPTASGLGLTWTQVATHTFGGASNRITLFRAMGWFHTPPTEGQVTIDFGGQSQDSVIWRLDAIENVSLLSDADAIVQSAAANANATAVNATLAAFDTPENSTYSVWTLWNHTVNPDAESGYAGVAGAVLDGAEGGDKLMFAAWRPNDDTTPGITVGTATVMSGIAVELRVARP